MPLQREHAQALTFEPYNLFGLENQYSSIQVLLFGCRSLISDPYWITLTARQVLNPIKLSSKRILTNSFPFHFAMQTLNELKSNAYLGLFRCKKEGALRVSTKTSTISLKGNCQ